MDLSAGVGVEPPSKFSKKEGRLDRTSIFRGGCCERRGRDFFQGVWLQVFHKK